MTITNLETSEFVVYDGLSGTELWRCTSPSCIGWSASSHPDIDGDGLRDVVVGAPGSSIDPSGSVVALRGSDGTVLWTQTYGASASKFGIGLGVIPDQNSDGVADIMVAMLGLQPGEEIGVLLSGATGEVLATAPGPVAVLLDQTRRRVLHFRSPDLDGSGVVDGEDVVAVALRDGTSDPIADLDFSGGVNSGDLEIVIDALSGGPPVIPADQYAAMALEDPLAYNSGWQLVSLLSGSNGPQGGDPPCQAEYEASVAAWRAYAQHMLNFPWVPTSWIEWPQWDATRVLLRQQALAAQVALDTCLNANGYRLWKPGTPYPPPLLPPPPPPPPPPPTNECPLDSSSPPPDPSTYGVPVSEDPCMAQFQMNTLACTNCRLQGTSIEPYTWCKDRAKAIYSSCVVAVPE